MQRGRVVESSTGMRVALLRAVGVAVVLALAAACGAYLIAVGGWPILVIGVLSYFALMRTAGMMDKLTVYPDRMKSNLESLGGVVHSQKVLLALTQAGMSREDSYRAVQRAAMNTWTALGTPNGRTFRDELLADPEVSATLDAAALDTAMDPAKDFRHIQATLARVFETAGA